MVRFLNKVGLTNWKRRIIALLILLPLMGVGSVELTSTSWFCNSCHIMNPYYDSWKHGAHKDVECVKCHISPGVDNFLAAKFNGLGQVVDDVLHRTSMKPSGSVSELACMRSGCHDVEKVKKTNKAEGKYLFKHEKHLGLEYKGIKVACATCHSHVKGDNHFEINTAVCVTCHLLESDAVANAPRPDGKKPSLIRLAVREAAPGGSALAKDAPPTAALPESHVKLPPDGCTSCHKAPEGTIERGGLRITHADYLAYGAKCESCHRGTTATPAPVESAQCYECHNFGIEKVTSTEEMHKVHNEGRHKIECFSCHGAMHHGPTAQAARLEQFECSKCHSDQHGVQRRTYLHKDDAPTSRDGIPSVSPMFLAHVDCTGCHIKERPVSVRPDSGATVKIAVPEACDACHKPGLGAEQIPLWQSTTRRLYKQVELALAAADEASNAAQNKATLDEVRGLLQMVRSDGSWGVHNPRYTQQALEQARNKLKSVAGAVGAVGDSGGGAGAEVKPEGGKP
jgi:nitrate/TMAO reductase-like tetraheme cytochrome c subunit